MKPLQVIINYFLNKSVVIGQYFQKYKPYKDEWFSIGFEDSYSFNLNPTFEEREGMEYKVEKINGKITKIQEIEDFVCIDDCANALEFTILLENGIEIILTSRSTDFEITLKGY